MKIQDIWDRIRWRFYRWRNDSQDQVLERWGYPPDLRKACVDNFEYVLKLSTGELWYFREATPISKEWVTISGFDVYEDEMPRSTPKPPFERDVNVRVSEIIWVADCPFGS